MVDVPHFIDGCRTPFQRAGTGFRDLTSYQLAAAAIGGLLKRVGSCPNSVGLIQGGKASAASRATGRPAFGGQT